MATNPNPRQAPTTTPPRLAMTPGVYPGVWHTSTPDKLATLLGTWGWARLKPWRRELIRLRRGDSLISITIDGHCVALGPGAVIAVHLAAQEVQS